MSTIKVSIDEGVAVLSLAREKVNAINEMLIDDLNLELDRLEVDDQAAAVVLTGREKFFSFGFDVPALLDMSREELRRFLEKFTALLLRLFTFGKPMIAAVNGHATAGGCMLIMACDFRVAAEGKARIGLNEIDLGVPVFASSAEMLKYWVGDSTAETILFEGTFYSVYEAAELAMLDALVPPEQLMSVAMGEAKELGGKPREAFRAIKALLRRGVVEKIMQSEKESLDVFVEHWFSEEAQRILASLKIRG